MTLASREIERDRTTADLWRELPAGSPDECAQPREHFVDLEWLGDVVVCTAVDALHLLVPAVTRRQDQDRCSDPVGAPAPQHGQSVDFGQTQIENDGIVLFGLAEKLGALAVARRVHRIARFANGRGQLLRQPRFVFSDQHTHVTGPSRPL